MKTLLTIALLVLAVSASFQTDGAWKGFKAQFGKKYASDKEEGKRYEIFTMNNLRAQYYQRINPEAEFGVTRFSDLTPEEFKSMYLNFHTSQMMTRDNVYKYVPHGLPDTFDQKDKGSVTPVKDQSQCGSCYIFSTVGNIESVWKNAGHPLVALSEQQVLDCDKVDDGCGGGWMWNVYEYVIKAGGLESQADYGYKAYVSTCKFDKKKVVATISSYVNVTNDRDETAMQQYLYDNAVLSVAVDATPFQYYNKGIISSGCGNSFDDLDHAVQATGWGVQGSTKYWNIKNSWGKSWGEAGYARLKLGSNTCGVAWVPTSSVA